MKSVRANRTVGLVSVAAAMVCACTAALALAEPTWQAPVNLSAPGQNAIHPEVAADPQGDAVAVWEHSVPGGSVVQAATRPARGVWEKPVDVSGVDFNVSELQVAVDQQGDAVAMWVHMNGNSEVVKAAVRPAGGTWQTPVELSAAGHDAFGPKLAVDAQGDAVVVWELSDGTNRVIQVATRPASSGIWQAPVDLSTPGQQVAIPRVVGDLNGDLIVAWVSRDGPDSQIIQAAARPAGGEWQAPVDLTAPGQDAFLGEVAVDEQGDAIVTWTRSNGTNAIVQAAARPAATGAWQAPVDLSAAGQNAADPRVAVGERGDAVAIWRRFNGPDIGSHSILQAAARSASGAWQKPVDLSAADQDAVDPQVALDAQGNAVAVWRRRSGFRSHSLQATARPGGGEWQAPVDLTAPGQDAFPPGLAIDAAGDAVAIWQGSGPTVQAALRPAGGVWQTPALNLSGTGAAFPGGFDVDGQGNAIVTWTRDGPPNTIVQATSLDLTGRQHPVPKVTELRISPTAFRAARSGPSVTAAAAHTGARVTYKLPVAARVRFTIQRVAIGRRVGSRCVKPSGRSKKRKRCKRLVRVPGSVSRPLTAGSDRFTFTGRLAGHRLKPGHYHLLATPRANNQSGRAARANFRIEG